MTVYPSQHWDRVDPKPAGWSTDMLARARVHSRRIGSSAVVVVQRGRVIAEWGDVSRNSLSASIRKSLLSALIGIAIDEKRLALGDTLEQLGIDDKEPALTSSEKQATVADLLTSRSGVYHPVDLEPTAVAALRPLRGSHPPGTFWYYNNWDFNALGTIYEKVTGDGIFTAFERRIARAIGLQDFKADGCRYGDARRSLHRDYAFRMSARDLARFGLLYLRGGLWENRQVVPSDWVAESVRPLVRPHGEIFAGRGYGYTWWSEFASDWAPLVTLPRGTYYALGFGGQYLFVVPEHELVAVHLADMEQLGWRFVNDVHMGRLMWLILAAAGLGDIGPDTSVESAVLASAAETKASLTGATLRYAESAPGGPYVMRLNTDGSASLDKGHPTRRVFDGKWWIEGDKLCRGWNKFHPNYDAWPVAITGSTVTLYGDDDTIFLQARLVRDG